MGITMRVEPRMMRRVVTAVAVALVVAGCGGSADESTTTSSTAVNVVEGSELAGVHVDVRRDPG